MKTLATIFAALAIAVIAFADTTTNVVTNVVYETRVKWDTYPVTNSSYEVYGGELTTNILYDTARWIWRSGGLALITNSVEVVTAGTATSMVYNIEWRMRPEYYPFAVTNVYTNIFVNGVNQR